MSDQQANLPLFNPASIIDETQEKSLFERLTPDEAGKCMLLGQRAAQMVIDWKKRFMLDHLLDPDALLCSMDFALAHLRRRLKLDQLLMTNDLEFFAEYVAIAKACRKRLDHNFPSGVHLRYAETDA